MTLIGRHKKSSNQNACVDRPEVGVLKTTSQCTLIGRASRVDQRCGIAISRSREYRRSKVFTGRCRPDPHSRRAEQRWGCLQIVWSVGVEQGEGNRYAGVRRFTSGVPVKLLPPHTKNTCAVREFVTSLMCGSHASSASKGPTGKQERWQLLIINAQLVSGIGRNK